MDLETEIKKVVKKYEKKNKVNISEVTAYKTRLIGFKQQEEIKVKWFEK